MGSASISYKTGSGIDTNVCVCVCPWGGILHTSNKQFLDTSRMSPTIQLNSDILLPRDSFRFHRLGVQALKIVPLHTLRMSVASHLCSDWLAHTGSFPDSLLRLQTRFTSPGGYLYVWLTTCKSEILMTSSLGLLNLLEKLTEPRGTSWLLDSSLLYKDIKSGTSGCKRCIEQGRGRGGGLPCLLSIPLSPNLYMLTNLESLKTQSSWGFMGTSLHSHGWWNHWPLATNLTSILQPLTGGLGWDWKSTL